MFSIIVPVYNVEKYIAEWIIDAMLTEGTRLGSGVSRANVFGMQNATTTVLAFYYFFNQKSTGCFIQ